MKKYQPAPTKINPSAIRSRVESRSAPNFVALPLTLAISPSIMSKTPPASITTPPQKRLWGITKAEDDVMSIPMRVIRLGFTGKAFAIGARGLSKR